MISMKGRVALVTGGGAGIGRATVEAFANLGANVVVAEMLADRAKDTEAALAKIGGDHLVVVADVRQAADVKSLMGQIDKKFGKLDVLMNNVGDFMGVVKPFEACTDEDIDTLYQENLRQIFTVTREGIPLLRKSKGDRSIIAVSSIEAFRGIPSGTVYSAFKHGITGFVKSLAVELAPEGIRVNAIAPETTDTSQVPILAMIAPQYKDHIPRWIPLGRFGRPSDGAGCAVFLATELSAWVTGTTVNMDGGALAAAGWYRTPENQWTNVPVVTAGGIAWVPEG